MDPQPSMAAKRPRSPKGQSVRGTKKTRQQSLSLARPAADDRLGWKRYWEVVGQPWRTEPEIDEERQRFLKARRESGSDWKEGIYPFKDISPPLTRADIEWLLAAHESGGVVGPVAWYTEPPPEREGLDLRGANLRGADLSGLPLACTRAGLIRKERDHATHEQRHMAAVHLDHANLFQAHLEGSILGRAHFEGANLESAFLERADLSGAHLEGAYLRKAQLQRANLFWTQLAEARLNDADLRGTDLRTSWMDGRTALIGTLFDSKMLLADIVWNNVPLTRIDWRPLPTLGDEERARQVNRVDGKRKDRRQTLEDYQAAVRAYLQLALALRQQGISEVADRFAYRAQCLQRIVFRHERQPLKYLFSWVLYLLTGYGYRMSRIIIAYLQMVVLFALVYWGLGVHIPHDISFWKALIISVTAFHGRVFSNPFTPGVPEGQIIVTAIEAVCGLIIEGLFVAMLVQRFFSR